ncbi:MAG TPA: NAD(P)/FAD-dependent oxidoreductase [Candidatus Eisenbacteria bacterium]|nr:NAD(P)/FAD-dependent oxidoreductase [Candidatus Eisenbacteria bacterium]
MNREGAAAGGPEIPTRRAAPRVKATTMYRTNTIIVGGGQAGLAMSRSLLDRGIGHLVLERGRVAERWRSERWDSLRLLTPRWQTRLPGWSYRGPDPAGFMTRGEVIDFLESYARSFRAPVLEGVTVLGVTRHASGGFRVETDRGDWRAPNVVVATGHCERPFVPDFAAALPPDVEQVVPTRYRNPSQLARGGVLVVGASATGVQLAAEIHRSGRPVTLAVGGHTRLPRTYRGRDIMEWLDVVGIWDERYDQVRDIAAARRQPSLQLIGSDDHRSLDLGSLQALGVRLAGRAVGASRGRVELADDLSESVAAADDRLARLLDRIDAFIRGTGLDDRLPAPESARRIEVGRAPLSIDLAASGVRTVLWATGYRRNYDWLHAPVLDARGEIRHDGGVTAVPGLYVLGLQFLRRRKSSLLDGVGSDAGDLADHIERRLAPPLLRAA